MLKKAKVLLLSSYMGLWEGLVTLIVLLSFFKKYKVIAPELPIYDLPLLSSTVKSLTNWLTRFITYKELEQVILLGNSLGGHIALLYTKLHPRKVKGLILTGSSGLYESAMGDSYPKRGSYEFIKKKCEDVFYDPKTATKRTGR